MHLHRHLLRGESAGAAPARARGPRVVTVRSGLVPSRLRRHQPFLGPRREQSRLVTHAHARAIVDAASAGLFGGESFYEILGVPCTAEQRTIKRAYHSLMREFHPDLAPEGLREDMAGLCVLLNEIYETLSDEERRTMYDTLAGFASNAVNPFLDTAFARDQVFVDEISCIGCGKCVRACTATFEIEASKYGRARVIAQGVEELEEIQVAIESCPVDCIHWVSLPQLSLLEVGLASMARIEVSVMQRFGRSGGNVFEVAYKAWERRMAAIEERAVAAAYAANGSNGFRRLKVDWSFWTNGASTQYDEQAEQRTAALDPTQRKIANLAASAARAARMWRFYSRTTGGDSPGLLSSSSMSSMDAR